VGDVTPSTDYNLELSIMITSSLHAYIISKCSADVNSIDTKTPPPPQRNTKKENATRSLHWDQDTNIVIKTLSLLTS